MTYRTISFFLVIHLLLIGSDGFRRDEDCKCKIFNTNLKMIVGGRQADSMSYPFMASISLKDDRIPSFVRKLMSDQNKLTYHSCGGVLLNNRHVLTAAHCVLENGRMSVGFGNDQIEIFDNGRIKVKNYFLHPEWNNMTVDNDIAVLELESPVEFTNSLSPGCLQNVALDHYSNLIATGFGLTSQLIFDSYTGREKPAQISQYLKELKLRDESDRTLRCLSNRGVICANSISKGESSCSGDSGSGLLSIKNGKAYIVGITSSTDQFKIVNDRYLMFCNGLTYYTKVQNYIPFIESVVGDDYCPYID